MGWQSMTYTDRVLVNLSAEYDITDELSGKVTVGYDKSDSKREASLTSESFNVARGAGNNGRGALNDLINENRLLEATLNYTKEFDNSNLDALVGFSYQDFNRRGRDMEGWGYATPDLNQMPRDLSSSASTLESMIS